MGNAVLDSLQGTLVAGHRGSLGRGQTSLGGLLGSSDLAEDGGSVGLDVSLHLLGILLHLLGSGVDVLVGGVDILVGLLLERDAGTGLGIHSVLELELGI